MKSCIFPGSFNPFHEGHIDVIKSAISDGFKRIIIAIAQNPDKNENSFDEQFAKRLIELNRLDDFVEIVVCKNKTIPDLSKDLGIDYIIRGYRDDSDYIYELDLIKLYQQYNKRIQSKLYKSSNQEIQNIRGSNLK
ncbi:MAG: adenylyltransferase/cytidyltransferase family protein [Mycoplasma sp.]